MPGAARVGIDKAGDVITGNLAPTVLINGAPVAVKGAAVTPHGIAPHAAPTMDGASATVFANGLPICRAGDAASCGHTATGSPNVLVG
ncbi:PAAR domain-containing protein [Pseudomonas sp. PNPG3]|uniref:PAAR domain-containing protein n=1 Tax=Pseudomonas sp. PNPG3 TaxID=2919497 RepID=UPI001FFDB34F|nr:PAAR domain-containing protein [Pseudomonas sp. PNPG3]MCK2122112.1 PAAR domain-containing protein [Pseudomonas sp. PNPG3]